MRIGRLRMAVLASAAAASAAGAQALYDSAGVPQPHLAKARAYAAQQKGWRHPARLKALIVSHGHADHFGGAEYLRQNYGVRIYMSAPDWDLARRQTLRSWQEAAPEQDIVVADGETLRFGATALRMFVSPGHTPGSLSMLLPVTDRGRPRTLLYVSGVSNRTLSPAMHAAFDRSYARLIALAAAAKVDGYIASHPSFDDAVFKLEWQRANPDFPNPFLIGPEDTALFLKQVRECNLNAADLSRAMPNRRTSARQARE